MFVPTLGNTNNILNISFDITESSVGTGAGCFPSGSVVHTLTGPRDIATLRKGDRVLAADDTGKMIYSEVCLFHMKLIFISPIIIPTISKSLIILFCIDFFKS